MVAEMKRDQIFLRQIEESEKARIAGNQTQDT